MYLIVLFLLLQLFLSPFIFIDDLTRREIGATPEVETVGCIQRGMVDRPKVITTENFQVNIEGWASSPQGFKRIDVVTEDTVLTSSPLAISRPDVRTVYPDCSYPGPVGFSVPLDLADVPTHITQLTVQAVDFDNGIFPIGNISVDLSQPFGVIENEDPIEWGAKNVLVGWAIAKSGKIRVRILAQDKEVATIWADKQRTDVENRFEHWEGSSYSGYEYLLSMRHLPRGRYHLTLELRDQHGGYRRLEGPEVINDLPIGSVSVKKWRELNPERIQIWAWAADEDDIAEATIAIDEHKSLGTMHLIKENIAYTGLPLTKKDKKSTPSPAVDTGRLFVAEINGKSLPQGLSRILVQVRDGKGHEATLPGPLLLRRYTPASTSCPGGKFRIFFPGDNQIFREGFPELRSFRDLTEGGCVEIGLRERVEYLRTTGGEEKDFLFDPNFPDRLRVRDQGLMSTSSLNELLAIAKKFNVPTLITLDGGPWADSKFPAPDVDIVDVLERDDRHVQWNQFGRAEKDDALQYLPGSYGNPQLARMMSLNRYNKDFLTYKKRNLQAAIEVIDEFSQEHPGHYVAVNLDPDQYINPWFYLSQWYDYNPDTLRQFREWLFHLGPYADDGPLAAHRYRPRMTLERLNELTGQSWATIEEVDPPRDSPDYSDPWQQIWTRFKRHLVAQHYDDLADWVVEAGLPPSRVYTSQTFIQADVAVSVDDPATGWTDQAGVSIEGAKPDHGHLGAILYGPASRNEGQPRRGRSLFHNIRRIDPSWGVAEFHPATIEFPELLPGHEQSYASIGRVLNAGARFISPMWGSHAADRMIYPADFRSYDAFTGTAYEYQLVWWLIRWQGLPAGSLLFPFGNDRVTSDDGWTPAADTVMEGRPGKLYLIPKDRRAVLNSPQWEALDLTQGAHLNIGGSWNGHTEVSAQALLDDGSMRTIDLYLLDEGKWAGRLEAMPERELTGIKLIWQPGEQGKDNSIALDEISLRFNSNERP